jgi:hypothetical protein
MALRRFTVARFMDIRRKVNEQKLAREAAQETLTEGTEQKFTVESFMRKLDSLPDEPE